MTSKDAAARKPATPKAPGSRRKAAPAKPVATAAAKRKPASPRKPTVARSSKAGTSSRRPAKRKAPAAPAADLKARGARVVSVFGPFESQALVFMPAKVAAELFKEPLPDAAPMHVVEGVLGDLAAIAERDPALARSAIAASALQLAYELANPYNPATSKSMCAKQLGEAMNTLRELAPPKTEEDRIDELAAFREQRRAASAGRADAPDQQLP